MQKLYADGTPIPQNPLLDPEARAESLRRDAQAQLTALQDDARAVCIAWDDRTDILADAIRAMNNRLYEQEKGT